MYSKSRQQISKDSESLEKGTVLLVSVTVTAASLLTEVDIWSECSAGGYRDLWLCSPPALPLCSMADVTAADFSAVWQLVSPLLLSPPHSALTLTVLSTKPSPVPVLLLQVFFLHWTHTISAPPRPNLHPTPGDWLEGPAPVHLAVMDTVYHLCTNLHIQDQS